MPYRKIVIKDSLTTPKGGDCLNEKFLEQKLMKRAAAQGGWALKLVCPGTSGVPDRLVLMPGGIAAFVEVKAPGEKPRALQLVQMRKLKQLGFPVFVLDDADQIETILEEVSHGVSSA